MHKAHQKTNSTIMNQIETTIHLNGEPRRVTLNHSIQQLIEDLMLTNKRIAVEVNDTLVPKSLWSTHILQAKDRVEIVHAIGGG